MPTRIDPTINVLSGPLNAAAARKGAEQIGKWEADLEKAEWRGATTIHDDLVRLRHHLEGGDLDGTTIAGLLIKRGESTERAAGHAGGDTVGKLHNLGQALVKAGEGLAVSAALLTVRPRAHTSVLAECGGGGHRKALR